MNADSIKTLQTQLGVPATGVFDAATSNAMNKAVSTSLAKNSSIGSNKSDAILNAYMTGDWSGVTDLTGKPFTDQQQQAAVAQATSALAPGYDAQAANDKATAEASLTAEGRGYSNFEQNQKQQFGIDKNNLDTSAAANGVLYSGARIQKQNQLSAAYGNADQQQRESTGAEIANTGRNFAYNYGTPAASTLSGYYSLPGAATYNAGVAGGRVTPSSLSSIYTPSAGYAYQGTQPVAQRAAIQTRAAGLLANSANKLALTGYKTQY